MNNEQPQPRPNERAPLDRRRPLADPRPGDTGAFPPADRSALGVCSYCGAPLEPQYYFCPHCATPYCNEEQVLSRLRPAPPTDGRRIALKAPQVQQMFWTYFTVLVGSAVVSSFLFRSGSPDLSLFFGSVSLLALTCVYGVLHWKMLAAQLRHFGLHRSEALTGVLLLVPLLGVNYGYHSFLRGLAVGTGPSLFEILRMKGLGEPTLIFFFCVFPGLTEEVAFRGLLQHWLQAAISPWRAIFAASALFTILHFSLFSAPYLFMVGVLLGWLKWKTNSLYPSMLVHFLHNFIVLEFFGF